MERGGKIETKIMDNEHSLEKIHSMISDIEAQLLRAKQMLADYGPVDEGREHRERASEVGGMGESAGGTVVEGVFDGSNMVGPDGKVYTVPANYASKSKLVEGDIMKLTIKRDGTFVYKQIGPVSRERELGTLVRDEAGTYKAVTNEGKSYKLLTASVTYFKGEPGDSVVLLTPHDMPSRWAAVENIVPEGSVDEADLLDVDDDGELDFGDELELEAGGGQLPMGDDMQLDP